MDNRRKLKLYQVELTAYCDMKCSYCPHPTMERVKGHMSNETLAKCIEHAKNADQDTLVLHHFGEPLLSPRLKDQLSLVAESDLKIQFSTNGLLLEKKFDMLTQINAPVAITLSMHQWFGKPPKEYFDALHMWQKRAEGTNITFLKAFNIASENDSYKFHRWSYGNDVPWDFYTHCFFLSDNWGVVLWNGDIVSCCADAEGESVMGNVYDENALYLQNQSWRGCDTCDIFGQQHQQMNRQLKHSIMLPPDDANEFGGMEIKWSVRNKR